LDSLNLMFPVANFASCECHALSRSNTVSLL
jgi:hypothetical protein